MMILDAGVFHLAERNPRRLAALQTELSDEDFAANEAVMAQVWTNPARQVPITRLLANLGVDVLPLTDGRSIGVLLAQTETTDVVDASIAVLARSWNQPVLTTGPDDLSVLGAITITL